MIKSYEGAFYFVLLPLPEADTKNAAASIKAAAVISVRIERNGSVSGTVNYADKIGAAVKPRRLCAPRRGIASAVRDRIPERSYSHPSR